MRLIAVVLGVGLVVLAGLAWLNRKTLAREVLTGWLASKGVAAEAEIEAFGPTTFTGRLRVGDPTRPEFAAERVHVRYRLGLAGLEVRSIVLTRPVLRAQLQNGRFDVGALDPLVREFLSRPPRPDAAKPRIAVDDGVLALTTDYGPIRFSADALVEDAILQRLDATSAPTRLRSDGFDLTLGQGAVEAKTRAGRFDVRLGIPLTTATAGSVDVRNGRLELVAHLPYPDLERRRGDGAVVGAATLTGAQAAIGDQVLDGVTLKAGFSGEARGWIPDLSVRGKATASLEATTGRFGAAQTTALRIAATSEDLAWTRKGGDRLAGSIKVAGSADGLTAGDLQVDAITAAFSGRAAASAEALALTLEGAVAGKGAWSGLGPPTREDAASVVAAKRAARSFRISAPALRVAIKRGRDGTGEAEFEMTRPVTLRAATGAQAVIYGSTRLAVSGGGLPQVDARLANLQLGEKPSVDLVLKVSNLSVGPVMGGRLAAEGHARLTQGGFTFAASRCLAFEAPRLELGANDIEDLAGRLCPTAGPILTLADGAWRLSGRAEAVRAAAPFLQAQVEDGVAAIRADGRGDRIGARLEVAAATLQDAAEPARFNPLALTGDLNLSGGIWRADLTFRQPEGPPVATAKVSHDASRGVGGVTIDTGDLVFAEGGLQPMDLSPLAGALGSPAVGSARFQGRFDWTPEAASSGGTLDIPRLDFKSPAGAVQGLSGKVTFESLAPLVAAPGQELRIEVVDAVVPLTKLRARFALADQLLQVEGGEAEVGGGRVRVETLEIPLTPDAPIRGVLHLEGVQLHDLFEASPFGDKVEFDAVVSGRVPFEARGDRVRVTGGELKADGPGRISIDRTALTGIEAGGDPQAPGAPADPNATFTGFAYQAMENLAFDNLEATIMSREDGRLGVLFHITGRHDPPKKQTLRLPLMDLIQRRFLGKSLPLPSGTGVNLTLDTTLNLDDLLADYAEYQRARSSGPVQP
ncbi:MAG: intermembrane phospholipid transport protein YdbH family protein [Pseudomonadota bacterium]